MKNSYDEDYFERGLETGKSCYSNYRWIPELTIPLAVTLTEYLNLSKSDTILDFGCAKGYLVKAFRLIHRQAFGCDVSEYALSNCPADVADYLYQGEIRAVYDWIICKDVLEHIGYEEIDGVIETLRKNCRQMFCVLPLGRDGKYVIPAYELDPTHIIREPIEWWEERFVEAGFQVLEKSWRVENVKENWSVFEKGNGFFICKSDCA